MIAPCDPNLIDENKPVNTNPIWATDEYAINSFISFCWIQFKLVKQAPNNLILIIQMLILLRFLLKRGIIRINPYPPNFSKIAAKIIDPSRGAST